jgi:hypothetical protein
MVAVATLSTLVEEKKEADPDEDAEEEEEPLVRKQK